MSSASDKSDLEQLLVSIAQRADALRLVSTKTEPADHMLEKFVIDIATQLRDDINMVMEQLGLDGNVSPLVSDAVAPIFRQ